MCDAVFNRHRLAAPGWDSELTTPFSDGNPLGFHRTLPGYHPTPLVPLPGLAKRLGIGAVWVKDEAHRLGLNAFKVLGASYAVMRLLKDSWETSTGQPFGDMLQLKPDQRQKFSQMVVCTATDGNHGRALAWAARRIGLKAIIYVPKDTVPARIDNIAREEAEVRVVDGSYDRAVEQCQTDAAAAGWTIVSDTSWPGYTMIPGWIQAAYTTMFREMENDLNQPDSPGIDFVFVPGGVGALAAAAGFYYAQRYAGGRPRLVAVEPRAAACLLESARNPQGEPVDATGTLQTVMAGLNCGRASTIAWPFIRDTFDLFLGIADRYALDAMRTYYAPAGGDPRIISGESGAATLGALLALTGSDKLEPVRSRLKLGPKSRVLLLNTEGATDPDSFERITGEKTDSGA